MPSVVRAFFSTLRSPARQRTNVLNVKPVFNRFPISPNVCYPTDSWATLFNPCYLHWVSMKSITRSSSTNKDRWRFRTIFVWSFVWSNISVRCVPLTNKVKHVYVPKRRSRSTTAPFLSPWKSNSVANTSIHRPVSTDRHGNISVWILNCISNMFGNTLKRSLGLRRLFASFSSSTIHVWKIRHRCCWSKVYFSRRLTGWNSFFPSCQSNKIPARWESSSTWSIRTTGFSFAVVGRSILSDNCSVRIEWQITQSRCIDKSSTWRELKDEVNERRKKSQRWEILMKRIFGPSMLLLLSSRSEWNR